jgi:CRP/FNR family transcriptional regulator, cyclic AMP receptor protein
MILSFLLEYLPSLMPVPLSLLEAFDIVAGLSEAHKKLVAESSYETVHAKRSIVVQKGERPDYFYMIVEGRIQGTDFTIDGREVGLYFLGEREFFGEMTLVDGLPSNEFLMSTVKTRLIQTPRLLMEELVFSTPQAAKIITGKIAARLRKLTEQRKILALPNPMQKVCAQLLSMIPPKAAPAPGAEVEMPKAPTHQELAIMINASRETVTRIFQVLQAENIVYRKGESLMVLKVSRLQDLATHGK